MNQLIPASILDKGIASEYELAFAMRLGEKHVEVSSDEDITCEIVCYFWQGKMYITDVKYKGQQNAND